ncbi:uroporphyrinogen-III C-methyltransferase [Rhodoligotrophos defluvii]|uniref:uroporphyrinogen-III C-methyltransferase n=1 Tax=Rhodoligotrophos defluvii TaxID=2561934 RepID=UPI0010C95BC6|nr:uroporphyrinogen-III C-methyltransferase [Rhodoligotrophos defluvii]
MIGRSLDISPASLPAFPPGTVWLCGAGPGDPGHLTLYVVSALRQADVIVHDALVDPRVLDFAHPEAEIIFAGKRGGKPSIAQDEIGEMLITLARQNRRVLRLKGGDPFVFGRGGEEALVLAEAGVPFRVFPGITSGLGGLAMASIPATMRGVNQAVILATGHSADDHTRLDWAALGRLKLPLVLYMAVRTLPDIAAALVAGGMDADTPAAVIENATLPDERIMVSTLDRVAKDLERQAFGPPALVVIGEIVRLREELRLLALQAAREAV